jgi:putative ABC transport system permease protein
MSSGGTLIMASARVALQQLWRHKIRSFLTLLGIMIGTSSVITIVSLGEGLRSYFSQFMSAAASADLLYIMPDIPMRIGKFDTTAKTFRNRDVEVLNSAPYFVSAVGGHFKYDALIRHSWRSARLNLSAEPAEYFAIEHLEIDRGRIYSTQEERAAALVCVAGSQVAEELYAPGEEILGSTLTVEGVRLKVIGVFKGRSALTGGAEHNLAVYMPLRTAQKRIFGGDSVLWIAARLHDVSDAEAAKAEAARLLRASRHIRSGADDDFKVYSADQWLAFLDTYLNTLIIVLGVVAVIALIVGGIGVMNIMLVIVKERTHEIGLRVAMGATPRSITLQFLIEAITLTLVGGLLGLLGGYCLASLACWYLRENYGLDWRPFVPPLWIAIELLSSVMIGLLAGVYPATKAGRLDPIKALHYE